MGSLMAGVYVIPLQGAEASAAVSYIRSDEIPWEGEVVYVALIFHYVFFGFFIYAIEVDFH